MADRGKYPDIFFRNGLREFEVLPPPVVWENIKPALIRREKHLSLLRFAAVAAILVSLSGFAFWLSNKLSNDLNGPAISLNQENLPEGFYQEPIPTPATSAIKPVTESFPVETIVLVNIAPQPVSVITNSFEPGLMTPSKGASLIRKGPSFLDKTIGNDLNAGSATVAGLDPVSDFTESPGDENKLARWSLSAMASPNYFSGTGIGPNQTFSNSGNSEKPAVSFSGGLAVSFTVNKRMTIQSGVYYSSLGQEVKDINTYGGFEKYYASKGEGTFGIQTSSGIIVTTNGNIFLNDKVSTRVSAKYGMNNFDPVKANLDYLSNSIIQNFNYLEVPLLVKYKAVDKRMDIVIIGGLSYNMLIGNSAFSYVDGERFTIGKTDEISPSNISSSLGLGFEYYLWEKVSLNLEPTFRYYITPLGGMTGAAAHPYSFGILSGLSFKF